MVILLKNLSLYKISLEKKEQFSIENCSHEAYTSIQLLAIHNRQQPMIQTTANAITTIVPDIIANLIIALLPLLSVKTYSVLSVKKSFAHILA